VIKIKLERYSN